MKRVSSYQRLKLKKELAEKIAKEKIDDLEHVILYPHSSRAKGIRQRIKIENDII